MGATAKEFRVPDLRGTFLRRTDDGSRRDPDASNRVAIAIGGAVGDRVGSYQPDDLAKHTHPISAAITGDDGVSSVRGGNSVKSTTSLATEPSGGSETRPKNAAVYYIIKL